MGMDLIGGWATFMAYEGMAPNTIACRTRLLRQFAKTCDPATATKADLVAFLSTKPSAASRSTAQSYIKVFYAWCEREGFRDDPTKTLPRVRAPQGDPRPADHSDVERMLAAADQRTRTMALLMVYCGLRSCEVAGVRHEHLRNDHGRWWLDIPRAKGGKAQSVPVQARVAEELLACPEWNVSAQSVQKMVKRALKRVDSKATPHQLRHYYGTQALATTDNLRVVQQLMRHASSSTTDRYTAVASEKVAEAADQLPWIA